MATLLTTAEGVFEWDLKVYTPHLRFQATEDDSIVCATVSHDGKRMAIAQEIDTKITIFDLKDNKQTKLPHTKNARNLTFGPRDQNILYYSTQKTMSKEFVVQSYNLDTLTYEKTFNFHRSRIDSITIGPQAKYILSTSRNPPQALLYSSSEGTSTPLEITTPLKQVSFEDTRARFFGINTHGEVTLFNLTSRRPGLTFPVRAIKGLWTMSRVIVICEDSKARVIDFEAKNILLEVGLTAVPASLYIGHVRGIYGLTNGKCEVWETALSWGWRRLYVEDVSDGPIINVGWTDHVHGDWRNPIRITYEITPKSNSPVVDYLDDYLDVFSPVKRPAELELQTDRKGKRPKGSKGSKTPKVKNVEIPAERDDKSLKIGASETSKVAFQESSKGNILSEKAQGKLPKKASSSKQPPQTPPKDLALRRHSAKSGQSSKTSEFEASASSPSKKMPDNRAEGTIEPMKIKISNLEIPVKMEPVADDNSSEGDLWTRAVGSGETTAIDSGTAKDRPPLGRVTVPSGTLPVDIGTAVMDVQTTLRSDIERLRLEVVKQFVSFKDEMGKKWKDEVEYLRDENVALKKRLEDLKREMKNKEKGSW